MRVLTEYQFARVRRALIRSFEDRVDPDLVNLSKNLTEPRGQSLWSIWSCQRIP